jgi:hypothetical protein
MNTVQIVVICIFVIFIITYLTMIGNLILNIDLDNDPSILKCNGISSSKDASDCRIEKISILSKNRTNEINTVNIIGIILGILLGVIHTQYVNMLEIDNTVKIIIHTVLTIIYISLIGVAGSTYQDYTSIYATAITSKFTIDDGARWKVAIKPLVPFFCALSISSLGIIVKTLTETMNTRYSSILADSLSSDSSSVISSE